MTYGRSSSSPPVLLVDELLVMRLDGGGAGCIRGENEWICKVGGSSVEVIK